MGKNSSINALIEAIDQFAFYSRKSRVTKLGEISKKASKVIKEFGSLNVFYEHSYYNSPLEAAIRNDSLELFILLVSLGADPLFKPSADLPSAAEILGRIYYDVSRFDYTRFKYEWIMLDKDSPLLTWGRLKANAPLFNKFKEANLISDKGFIDKLPLHVAVEAGRFDLVQEVIQAAGSIQKSGDVWGASILKSAILAVLKGKKNSLVILNYLVKNGADFLAGDIHNLPAIIQVIYASTLYLNKSNVREEKIISVVKLLLENGASLDVVNPNNGFNPLMSALLAGHTDLFTYLLESADTNTINYQAKSIPGTMAFQLFDRDECKIPQSEILKFLPTLKIKGLMFDQTKEKRYFTSPFESATDGSNTKLSAANMSILHYYVDGLAHNRGDPFESMDRHIGTIQTLLTYGVNPTIKATLTQTNEQGDSNGRENRKVHATLELTAAEYVRQIVLAEYVRQNSFPFDEITPFGYFIYTNFHQLLHSKDESSLLNRISHLDKSVQVNYHKKFHQFRNLELVLSGQKPIPYAGMPDADKLARVALKKQLPVVTHQPLDNSKPEVAIDTSKQTQARKETFKPEKIEANLFIARGQHNQSEWQAIKKPLIEFVKQAESMQEFLTRIKQFETPLQLHYNITTNPEGKVISQGSFLYRFFHMFDSHKFPQSWETLRQFGKDTYGVDINTEYDEVKANTI